MASLNGQWKALQKQLARLEVQTRKVRGVARRRLKRVERQTRVAVRKAIRQAEPRVRQADPLARAGFNHDLVAPRGIFAHRVGGQSDAVFLGFDFFDNSDSHGTLQNRW